jgi:hypothetical protein
MAMQLQLVSGSENGCAGTSSKGPTYMVLDIPMYMEYGVLHVSVAARIDV